MKLLGNRIIIVPVVEETHSGSRIIRARMSREMPDRGTVQHISRKASEMTGVKWGDKIIFDRHHQQLAEDEKTTMIDAKHVLAIIT